MAETTLDLVSMIRSSDFANLHDELVQWRPQELAGTTFLIMTAAAFGLLLET
jgi:hypothetical protein